MSRTIHVRVSDDEHAAITAAAERLGLQVSDYVRQAARAQAGMGSVFREVEAKMVTTYYDHDGDSVEATSAKEAAAIQYGRGSTATMYSQRDGVWTQHVLGSGGADFEIAEAELPWAAKAAGRAWAEREAEAIEGELPERWGCDIIDAKALLPEHCTDDQTAEVWLIECNKAAAQRWDELVEEYSKSR